MNLKYFGDLVNELGKQLKIDIKVADKKELIKSWINIGYKEFQMANRWSWRKDERYLQTVEIYNTGTVSATEDSTTITGSGTSFASGHEDWFLKIDGDTNWYRVAKVASTTSLVLELPYGDDTVTGRTYKLCIRFYLLPNIVDDIIGIWQYDYNTRVKYVPKEKLEVIHRGMIGATISYYNADTMERKSSSYTTGTVTGTRDGATLTGSGTSWLANVYPGDTITIANYEYQVSRVDNDTQLVLIQSLMTSPSSATYSAARKNQRKLEFNVYPDDKINLLYTFMRKPYNMLNEQDEPEIPEKYRYIILEAAKYYGYEYLADAVNITGINIPDLKQSISRNNYKDKVFSIIREEDIGDEPSEWTWS